MTAANMAEGGWVVLGAAIGTIGSVVTTLLNAWLPKDKPDYLDQGPMKLLKAVLSDSKYPWHPIERLSHIVGLSHEDKLTEQRELTPHLWVHPDEDR